MAHIPVLAKEVLAGLALQPNVAVVDGTLGGGGHAEAMLEATSPAGRLLGLDQDPEAIERAQMRLARFAGRTVIVQASFSDMDAVAAGHGFTGVAAVLLDLGISSWQLDQPERGFSFQYPGPLDMRMDPRSTLTAGIIVNEWPQDELAGVIYRYGEEPRSRRIARAIVAARPLKDTSELAEVVRRAAGGHGRQRIHPATRTFQALRIAVNDELNVLEHTLPKALALLAPAGRLAVITFHSLEDRIVKRFIQRESQDCICPPGLPMCVCGHKAQLRPVYRKPLQAGEAEVAENPRSRSAKLRVAEKLGAAD